MDTPKTTSVLKLPPSIQKVVNRKTTYCGRKRNNWNTLSNKEQKEIVAFVEDLEKKFKELTLLNTERMSEQLSSNSSSTIPTLIMKVKVYDTQKQAVVSFDTSLRRGTFITHSFASTLAPKYNIIEDKIPTPFAINQHKYYLKKQRIPIILQLDDKKSMPLMCFIIDNDFYNDKKVDIILSNPIIESFSLHISNGQLDTRYFNES